MLVVCLRVVSDTPFVTSRVESYELDSSDSPQTVCERVRDTPSVTPRVEFREQLLLVRLPADNRQHAFTSVLAYGCELNVYIPRGALRAMARFTPRNLRSHDIL